MSSYQESIREDEGRCHEAVSYSSRLLLLSQRRQSRAAPPSERTVVGEEPAVVFEKKSRVHCEETPNLERWVENKAAFKLRPLFHFRLVQVAAAASGEPVPAILLHRTGA